MSKPILWSIEYRNFSFYETDAFRESTSFCEDSLKKYIFPISLNIVLRGIFWYEAVENCILKSSPICSYYLTNNIRAITWKYVLLTVHVVYMGEMRNAYIL